MKDRSLIATLAALSMLGALSIDTYLPALPSIAATFLATAPAVQQTLTVYLFAFAFMMLFYGTLSDSFGRRPVILGAMGLYVLSSLGAGCATSLTALLFFRFLQGLSAGAGSVVGRAMVGDLFSGAEAQRTMSYISAVFGLAPALAPILGGWLQAWFGWRSIFWFIAFFSFVLLLICWRGLLESLPRAQRHPFHLRPILLRYWEVGSHCRFMLQALSIALSFSGIMFYVGSAPAFVLNILHLSVTQFGWLFIPIISGMMSGSILAGRWAHGHRPKWIIGVGFTVMAVSSAIDVIYTSYFTPTLPWAVLPIMIYSFGMALATPAMTMIGLELFPSVRGLAASLQSFIFMGIFSLGCGLICPLLFGSAFRLAVGSAVGFILAAVSWWAGCRGNKDASNADAVPSSSALEELIS